jgi:hypothetical protein
MKRAAQKDNLKAMTQPTATIKRKVGYGNGGNPRKVSRMAEGDAINNEGHIESAKARDGLEEMEMMET